MADDQDDDEFDRHYEPKNFNAKGRAAWEAKRMHERYCVSERCGNIYHDYKPGPCPDCGAWTNAS
jgi:hypothetical protein